MLSKLLIHNYAIIEELEIKFSSGFNIITGETGAGKSILMGALNLILGQRADSSVLMDAQKKCIIEGRFEFNNTDTLSTFFQEQELDLDEEIIIRREIASNGKSRSFINDTPVNLSVVKQLGMFLVDLHQQFDTLDISSENFQREVLDALADNSSNLKKLKLQFDLLSNVRKELAQLKHQQESANKELDYNQFLFDELEELQLKENELEGLDQELKVLNNAEHIKQQLEMLYSSLNGSEQPIVQQLKSLLHKLKSLESFHSNIEEISKRLNSTTIELEDIADELSRMENSVKYDPEKIVVINERISSGYKLMKKHGANSTSDLIVVKNQLQIKLEGYTNISSSIERLEKEQEKLYIECLNSAKQISKKRVAQVDGFVSKVNQLLNQVGMPNARIKVRMDIVDLNSSGIDAIDFLFDANKSNKFESIGKVASGGELSRLMLSIKSLVAQKLALPTLIFDEIDTGISGEAAKQVGIIMKDLSSSIQLISITHQPQIAAKANHHYYVYKETKSNKIATKVSVLSKEERVIAVAKMLGGENPSAAAIENAKEMIDN
jgi:DNA repair protein RecN (Recombination protein N)